MIEDPAEELRTLTRALESVVADRSVLGALSVEERTRLLSAAGDLFDPDVESRRQHAREQNRRHKAAKVRRDQDIKAATGIRELRTRAVFHSPNVFAPVSPEALPRAPLEDAEPADDGRIHEAARGTSSHCYICKAQFSELHHFYDQMCGACGDFNFAKRSETTDLHGRTALVTGGRVKIGYQAALKLLRAGVHVIVTTRFPRDAALRFAEEPDFGSWQHRVEVFGLDLRHTPSVETFCAHLSATRESLDYIVNNACQTVRRPPEFYRHMLGLEHAAESDLPSSARSLLRVAEPDSQRLSLSNPQDPASTAGSDGAAVGRSVALSQLRLLADDGRHASSLFPEGQLDHDLQQVDLRDRNSWRMMMDEVSTIELLETQLVNAVAPFVLNARLKHMLVRAPGRDQHIVNVSAVEGQFYRRFKTTRHPHTNMAKAALNMMTRTSAADYIGAGIHMNSVDTGWVTDEDASEIAARKTAEHRFHPPLDIIDGAARIVDPIIAGTITGNHVWGLFLKDYQPTDW